MPKDGLIRLPDHIVAPLMRALMVVRHNPHSRLLLQPAEHPRPPVWGALKSDYDVTWRGEKVGRIWRHTYEREPHEGDEPTLRACGELERAVVAGAEAGVPVGLVEAEHEGARDPVAVHDADELLVAPDHPVDVRAEVRVGVEDLEVGGEVGAEPLVPRRRDLPCSLERLHKLNLAGCAPTPCRLRKGHCRRGAAGGSKGAVHSPRSEAP